MKIYKCMVNLGGPILHLAPKNDVSAAEVDLLLHLHGSDSVRNLEETAEVEVPHGQLYDYLSARYGEKAVEGKFGPKSRKLVLPTEIDLEAMFAGPDEEADGEAEMMVDPTKAALEAAAISRGNAEPARKTLTLKQPLGAVAQ